jgi:hypothetical protein
LVFVEELEDATEDRPTEDRRRTDGGPTEAEMIDESGVDACLRANV